MKEIILLLSVFLVAGCVSQTGQVTSQAVQIVANGDHVFVNYTGTLEDGSVFDSSDGRAPLEFDAGAGQMIKGFDDAVIGMQVNEEKVFSLKPEDAYGTWSEENVIAVNASDVPEGVKAGDTLYTSFGQPVKVISVNSTTAVIDANHPLAGKTLTFVIKIVKIEKAQE